jgi:outer membrane protein TolC
MMMLRVPWYKWLLLVCLTGSTWLPVCAVDHPLTLADVVTVVTRQNLALQQATDQVVIAKSRYRQQWTRFLPSVAIGVDHNVYNLPYIAGRRNASPQLDVSVSVPLNQPYVIKESRQWLDAAQHDLTATLQQGLAAATNAYYDALEARLLVLNARQAIAEAEAQRDLAMQHKTAGGDDDSRAQSQVVQQQRRLTSAINRQAQTLQLLKQILNLPVETDLSLVTSSALTPITLLPPQGPGQQDKPDDVLLDRMRQSHPVLRRLQAELHALQQQVRQEQTRWAPTLTGTAYWGTLGSNLASQQYVQDAGLLVKATLLDRMGTTIPLRVSEKQAEVRQKQAELLSNQRQLETDFIQARLDSQALLDNLTQTTHEKTLAARNYNQALQRYTANEIPFVTITDAQESLINARNTFIQTLFGYNRAQVRKMQAIGQLTPTILTGRATP